MNFESLEIWVICTSYLFLKMYSNSLIQGLSRLKSKSFTHEDDLLFFGKGEGKVGAEHQTKVDLSATSIWRNDLENIPMFLFLFLGFCLTVNDKSFAIVYALVFCIARTFHSLFLYKKMQPYRNISYHMGCIVCMALIVHIFISI